MVDNFDVSLSSSFIRKKRVFSSWWSSNWAKRRNYLPFLSHQSCHHKRQHEAAFFFLSLFFFEVVNFCEILPRGAFGLASRYRHRFIQVQLWAASFTCFSFLFLYPGNDIRCVSEIWPACRRRVCLPQSHPRLVVWHVSDKWPFTSASTGMGIRHSCLSSPVNRPFLLLEPLPLLGQGFRPILCHPNVLAVYFAFV